MSIDIKESKKGSFTSWCKKQGFSGVTEECKQRGRASKDERIRKKAVFATNAAKWNRYFGGEVPQEYIDYLTDSCDECYHGGEIFRYNQGGPVNNTAQSLSSIGQAVQAPLDALLPGAGTAASLLASTIPSLFINNNPTKYAPLRQNETLGYAEGGEVEDPVLRTYANKYKVNPKLFAANLNAEGYKRSKEEIFQMTHGDKTRMTYSHPTSEVMMWENTYPISGAEFFGLDFGRERLEKMVKDGEIDKSVLDKIKEGPTKMEGKSKNTLYFQDLDTALDVYGATLARKAKQARYYAKKHGIKLDDQSEAYWTAVSYNAGAGNMDKMMASYKEKGLLENNKYLSDDYKPSSWATPHKNAISRLKQANAIQYPEQDIPTYNLPMAEVSGGKRRPDRLPSVNEASVAGSSMVSESTRVAREPADPRNAWGTISATPSQVMNRRTDYQIPSDPNITWKGKDAPIVPSPVEYLIPLTGYLNPARYAMKPGQVTMPNLQWPQAPYVSKPMGNPGPTIPVASKYNDVTRGARGRFHGPKPYQQGGDIPLAEGSIEVNGNPGIDTNYREVVNQPVALTEGEVVKQTNRGAYVFSNTEEMLHPLANYLTFSDVMKPIEKGTGKAEKTLSKDPTDKISQNTIAHHENISQINMSREEMERMKRKESSVRGGKNMAMDSIRGFQFGGIADILNNTMPFGPSTTLPRLPEIVPRKLPTLPIESLGLTPQQYPITNPRKVDPLAPLPTPLESKLNKQTQLRDQDAIEGISNTLTPYKASQDYPLSTTGDDIYTAAKSLEFLGKGIMAMQPANQYRTDRYNIDAPRYNPQRILDQNLRSYRSASQDINTGSASTDRTLKTNLYAQKMRSDVDAIRQYDEMQRQSDVQIAQANMQGKAMIDQINEQTLGRQAAIRDTALTSLGELGRVFQDRSNTAATNRIMLATLNNLSRHYGVDVEYLKKLMKDKPEDFNQMLVRYQENS